jgi:hypothetical protein
VNKLPDASEELSKMIERRLSRSITRLFGRIAGVLASSFSLSSAAAPMHAAGHSEGDLRVYMFGHSLMTNGTEPTSIFYWMNQLSRAHDTTFRFSGQYGFLSQHVDSLPPEAQWGFPSTPGFWNSDVDSFASANFNAVLITPSNFSQWQHPTIVYESGSPVSHTLELIDWVTAQEQQGIDIFVYENWPDMAGYVAGELFPPTASEFASYNAYTLGEFNNWWAEYLEELTTARPDVRIVSIPVGPTIAKMLTETSLLSGIPVTDLYIDSAPHGQPTIYFLSGLITYAGMYGKMPPENYEVPSDIHPLVRQNYKEIVRFVAREIGVE